MSKQTPLVCLFWIGISALAVPGATQLFGKRLIEPFGPDSFRVRVAKPGHSVVIDNEPWQPLVLNASGPAVHGNATQGNLRVSIDAASGLLSFYRVADDALLLAERAIGLEMEEAPGSSNLSLFFTSPKLFGMGQNRQACYKEGGAQTPPYAEVLTNGSTMTLARGEGGAANTLPWLLSATVGEGASCGVWMNNPGLGDVVFSNGGNVEWRLVEALQLDYVVTTYPMNVTPAERAFTLLERFTSWFGRGSTLPDWALGYWHSRNRYSSQSALLEVARGFHNRSVPVDIIAIDWWHWKRMGDWSFDETAWPSPTEMVDELSALGMRPLVSVWPFTTSGSRSYDVMTNKSGWLTRSRSNSSEFVVVGDGALVDATNDDAMAYVLSLIVSGYIEHNITSFWLDSCEPEDFIFPQWGQDHWADASWTKGTMASIGQSFPWWWSRAIHDGLSSLGVTDFVILSRAVYAGSARWGAALFAGDIHSTWEVLRSQIRTGLSAQMSGIGLWTTDIGGFTTPCDGNPVVTKGACNTSDPAYAELVVRWFQFGTTLPIFRQHGSRPTAIWNYPPEFEAIMADTIRFRAGMKKYLAREHRKLSKTGRPINRPLWWDYPTDKAVWEIDDEFSFGDEYLAAPILELGARSREVYLPDGKWTHAFTGERFQGGHTVTIDAPLEHFPLLHRDA